LIPIVLAYKRAELVQLSFSRLLEIDSAFKVKYGSSPFSRILFIHDGIREEDKEKSKRFHNEVREMCLDLEKRYAKVTSIVFDDNLGLTNQMFRIGDVLDSNLRSSIFIEEDKAPTLQGIEFLNQVSNSMDSKIMVDTLPLNKHLGKKNTHTSTLFTDNGNTLVGEDLYELAKHLWRVNDKYQEEFERNLHAYLSNFLSGFSLKKAFGYYSKYFSWGLTNRDRPDSLLSYALVLSKKFKACPKVPLSENWSDRDTRGKNVNTVPDYRGADCNFSTTEIWGSDICPRCEKQGVSERIELNQIRALKVGLNYRISKYLNSKQKQ
jgi:hypothetical protein